MREKIVEIYLRDKIKSLKGIAFKFVSPGNAGVPDRLVLLPNGRCIFVELKAPGKKTTPLQDRQIERIKKLGFKVEILDSPHKVDEFIEKLNGDNYGV